MNQDQQTSISMSDNELVRLLPGFSSNTATVNGIELHYVQGGSGPTIVLLPGWPQTWWAYHKIMPLLANSYRVIVVDIRGMGSSGKPTDGYDKKTMAADIYALVQQLGDEVVYMAGHDIGAGVAYSFAANYPERTKKLLLLDTPPVDESIYKLPMLPLPGSTGAAGGNGDAVYPWWLAFNQVRELPEELLLGRGSLLVNWLFDHLLINNDSVSATDRNIYANAYNYRNAIRAMNSWYQAFPQDITDNKAYSKLQMQVAGIGGTGYTMLQHALPTIATNVTLRQIANGGHFIAEEQPIETARLIIDFLSTP